MKFIDIKEAIQWIESQVKFKPKTDLTRMHLACLSLGNPQNSYKIIHIAGTNGKGSVASYLTTVLMKQFKVGRFTSPYIVKFNERISVNLEMIDDVHLLQYINFIYDFNEQFFNEHQERLSFFELITLIGFLYFKDQKVDYVVLEVGIGGLLDSTNVVSSQLALITNIGYDHMNTLGNTLEEIALNKLGIVKHGVTLITTVQDELQDLFRTYTKKVGSQVHFITDDHINLICPDPVEFKYEYHRYHLSLKGLHQIKNAVLAIKAINYLEPKMPLQLIKDGIKETTWPGRFEVMHQNPLVILDGAHNTHGIHALIETINTIYKNKRIHFIFCAMADKETKEMLGMLSDIATSITLTHFDYKRVSPLEDLIKQTNLKQKYAYNDPFEAIKETLIDKNEEDIIIITGSLYFVSLVRPYFLSFT